MEEANLLLDLWHPPGPSTRGEGKSEQTSSLLSLELQHGDSMRQGG